MKYDWKKQEKALYGAKKVPSLIVVPAQKFLMISGKGNPNEVDFSNRVAALYSLAYAIKMVFKADALKYGAVSQGSENDIRDYTVYPLEGVWKIKDSDTFVKEKLEYTIMIRQPDFITEDMVATALERVKQKKPTPLLDEIRLETMQDGKCIEILHIGAFDDEPVSFEKMNQFAEANGLERIKDWHREIYLNNANRVEKSKLKTILRYPIE